MGIYFILWVVVQYYYSFIVQIVSALAIQRLLRSYYVPFFFFFLLAVPYFCHGKISRLIFFLFFWHYKNFIIKSITQSLGKLFRDTLKHFEYNGHLTIILYPLFFPLSGIKYSSLSVCPSLFLFTSMHRHVSRPIWIFLESPRFRHFSNEPCFFLLKNGI